MDNLAVKSGMRGMERREVGGSQPDKAPGGNPTEHDAGPGEQDPPISHFMHPDGQHLNVAKLHEHIVGHSKGAKTEL